jgi:hypothetical protein
MSQPKPDLNFPTPRTTQASIPVAFDGVIALSQDGASASSLRSRVAADEEAGGGVAGVRGRLKEFWRRRRDARPRGCDLSHISAN